MQLSTNIVRGASKGQQCDCVVGRFKAARLLRIRLAISTFVMLPLSIACSICHATTSLIALSRFRSTPSMGRPGERRVKSVDEPMSLSSFIWSVADLLRGDYKQSEYGKVILPFTVLRRMDCVLEKTKEGVLAENKVLSCLRKWELEP